MSNNKTLKGNSGSPCLSSLGFQNCFSIESVYHLNVFSFEYSYIYIMSWLVMNSMNMTQ